MARTADGSPLPDSHQRERAFAAASLPDAHYAEYYARLVETAETWRRLKSELAMLVPDARS